MESRDLELVLVGEELLSGAVREANLLPLARSLVEKGFRIRRVSVISDQSGEIERVLSSALSRTGLVVSCGGLGPTEDDRTLAQAARIFARKLYLDRKLLASLKQRYSKLERELSEDTRKQALVPQGAKILPNPRGAAPGIVLSGERGTLILLPGVPSEVIAITEKELIPYLVERFQTSPQETLFLRTAGQPETEIAERIKPVLSSFPGLGISYLPLPGILDLLITLPSNLSRDSVLGALRGVLGEDLYAEERNDLSEVVGEKLRRNNQTLSVAESCTGGMLASRIVDVAGSSDYFLGGVVSYSNQAKIQLLDVSSELLKRHGAVSPQVAEAMAQGAKGRFSSTFSLSTTGIAGPGGGSRQKPVGLVYVGLAGPDDAKTYRFHFPGDRQGVRERTVIAALDLLRLVLR